MLYLAKQAVIKTNADKDCLTVESNKIVSRPCSNKSTQKFDYVLQNQKSQFKTSDGKCFGVGDSNYIIPVPCDQTLANWKWRTTGHIRKFGVDEQCFKIDEKKNLIIAPCETQFKINFTDEGTNFCKDNLYEAACGPYGNYQPTELVSNFNDLLITGYGKSKSINYGNEPNILQESKTTLLDCSKTNINKIIVGENNNIGVRCRGDNKITYMIPNLITDGMKNRYYKDNIQTYVTDKGFNGALVGANTAQLRSFHPYAPDVPAPSSNLVEYMEYFDCPYNQVITQLIGTHDDNKLQSLKIICDTIEKQDKYIENDIFLSTLRNRMFRNLRENVSRTLRYFEIYSVESLNAINDIAANSFNGSDTVVLIKIIFNDIHILDLERLNISKYYCLTDTSKWNIKGENYNKYMTDIKRTLESFDPFMESINMSDLKNTETTPKLLPLARVIKNMLGFYISITDCSNIIIHMDRLIRDAVLTRLPVYIVIFNSNVCFQTMNTGDFIINRSFMGEGLTEYKITEGFSSSSLINFFDLIYISILIFIFVYFMYSTCGPCNTGR
jgi:hypothetical protein